MERFSNLLKITQEWPCQDSHPGVLGPWPPESPDPMANSLMCTTKPSIFIPSTNPSWAWCLALEVQRWRRLLLPSEGPAKAAAFHDQGFNSGSTLESASQIHDRLVPAHTVFGSSLTQASSTNSAHASSSPCSPTTILSQELCSSHLNFCLSLLLISLKTANRRIFLMFWPHRVTHQPKTLQGLPNSQLQTKCSEALVTHTSLSSSWFASQTGRLASP